MTWPSQGMPLSVEAEDRLFDNLIPYTDASAAWSDRHSLIALHWPHPEAMGLQHLHALVGFQGVTITEQLLSWQLVEAGETLPLHFHARTFRPDGIREHDAGYDLDLVVTVAAPARNALGITFTLTNHTDKERTIDLRFLAPPNIAAPTWQGPFPLTTPPHLVALADGPPGSWATVFRHHEHGQQIEWVRDFAVGLPNGAPLEFVCRGDLTPQTLALPPQGQAQTTLLLGFGLTRGRANATYAAAQSQFAQGWSPRDETTRLLRLLAEAPPLPPRYVGQLAYERMYAHAIAGIQSLYIQGEGGYCGTNRLVWVTKQRIANAFYWDTAISCMATAEFAPQLAQEAISCFADNVNPRGAMPGTLTDTYRSGEGQAPIMAWAVWEVMQHSRDLTWLRQVYPALVGEVRFWQTFHQSPRGLVQWYNSGQIGDNDARFDAVGKREVFNEAVAGLESPDINALLVIEMRCLAQLATRLGDAVAAQQWDNEAQTLAARIVDYLYFPDDDLFLDVQVGTHERFSGVCTPMLFIPLLAGVPLPDDAVHRMITRHLLNPAEFFGVEPFPSLAYNDPRFDPASYWRGRLWPHVGCWMLQILWQWGYQAEAQQAAEHYVELMASSPWFHENYYPAHAEQRAGVTARAPGVDAFFAQYPAGTHGIPEYNWAQATVIRLLLERYQTAWPGGR